MARITKAVLEAELAAARAEIEALRAENARLAEGVALLRAKCVQFRDQRNQLKALLTEQDAAPQPVVAARPIVVRPDIPGMPRFYRAGREVAATPAQIAYYERRAALHAASLH